MLDRLLQHVSTETERNTMAGDANTEQDKARRFHDAALVCTGNLNSDVMVMETAKDRA
jgi:hypothetical protein